MKSAGPICWLALFAVLSLQPAEARDLNLLCQAGQGKASRPLWNRFLLRVGPSAEKRDTCTAEILAPDGGVVFARDENTFWWNPATGKDINGDEHPDVVIEAFTGPPDNRWRYWIFSINPDPMLVGRLDNDDRLVIGYGTKGRIILHTEDQAFDRFDGLGSLSPRADLFFVLEGDRFKDVTSEFITAANFEALRKRIETLPMDRFRQLTSTQDLSPELMSAKSAVLTLVLAYLDSGHDQEAWKALDEFWPKSDLERIKQAVVSARSKGTLSAIAGWNRDHLAE